jgi:RHS repeat-associated protein
MPGFQIPQKGNPVASTLQYTYDAVGNRLTSQVDAAATTSTYDVTSNRLQMLAGSVDAGYMAGAASVTFIYNNANRLTQMQVGSAAVATYAVNALGQRLLKTAGGVTTRFVYDEAGHLIGEYDAAGSLLQETVWLEDLPIATLRPTGTGTPTPIAVYYVHPDHLGTPRAITRPSDNLFMWRWDNTDPFGNSLPNENPANQGVFTYALRFPGQYYDAETGTHYNYFRDYDPTIGRYVQSDPIGLKGGPNTYAYVYDSPIRFSDPKGLDIWQCSRPVKWYLGGVGNHSYIWDDRNNQCCGRDDGKDPLKDCKERGPNGGDACVRIAGSGGVEGRIMSCCQKSANDGSWRPFKNDCHTSIERCLDGVVPMGGGGAAGGRLGACSSCWIRNDNPDPPPLY